MLKPDELETAEGSEIWETFVAASDGDVEGLRRLISKRPSLSRAEYWYTPAIHFAVREGHIDAVRLLLDAGADPEKNGLYDGSAIVMAKDRGHAAIANMLESERDRRHRTVAGPENPAEFQSAFRALEAAKGDLAKTAAVLDAHPTLIHAVFRDASTLLHGALRAGVPLQVIALLLDRGADVNARRGGGSNLEPIDMALWDHTGKDGVAVARLLVSRGATYDLTVASALGDLEQVRQMLDAKPERIRETRPSGRRPLSAAIEKGYFDIARLLLERGADPNWDEPDAPHGLSVHAAVRSGNRELLELLFAHGADPNAPVDSSADPLVFAPTPEIADFLIAHGATPPPVDDDDQIRRLLNDPRPSNRGIAFAFACGDGRRDMLQKLLRAGIRIPEVLTSCQGYLLKHTDMLRTLLEAGMNPNLMNWQHQTLLHFLSHYPNGGDVERAAILLDAGADIHARDEEYLSTPLGWAARKNAKGMVEFLLARGAATTLPDDEPWAMPLAWAERRGHIEIAAILRKGL